VLQLDVRHAGLDLPRPGRRVEVTQRADGALLVRHAGRTLTWVEVARRPAKVRAKAARKPVGNNKPYKPGQGHPSNRTPACPGSRASRRGGLVGSASSPPAAGRRPGDSSTADR